MSLGGLIKKTVLSITAAAIFSPSIQAQSIQIPQARAELAEPYILPPDSIRQELQRWPSFLVPFLSQIRFSQSPLEVRGDIVRAGEYWNDRKEVIISDLSSFACEMKRREEKQQNMFTQVSLHDPWSSLLIDDYENLLERKRSIKKELHHALNHEIGHALLHGSNSLREERAFRGPSFAQAREEMFRNYASHSHKFTSLLNVYLGEEGRALAREYGSVRLLIGGVSKPRTLPNQERVIPYAAAQGRFSYDNLHPVIRAQLKELQNVRSREGKIHHSSVSWLRGSDHSNTYLVNEHPEFSITIYTEQGQSQRWEMDMHFPGFGKLRGEEITQSYHANQVAVLVKEYEARLVSSLVDTNFTHSPFGPLTPTPSEIDFLSKYTFNGHQIFGPFLQRYEIAQAWHEEGIPWNESKERLRNIERFVEDGLTYSWPRNDLNPVFNQPAPFSRFCY